MDPLEKAILKSDLSDRTKKSYLAAVRSFLEHADDERTGSAVAHWHQALRKRMQPLSVKRYLRGLQFAAEQLGEEFAFEALIPKSTAPPAGLSWENVKTILASIPDDTAIGQRDRAMIGLMTGAAFGQLAVGRLIGADVKVSARSVSRVKLTGHLWQLTERWLYTLAPDAQAPLFPPLRRSALGGYEPLPAPLSHTGLHQILRTRGRVAGVKKFSPKKLYFAFPNVAREAGYPEDVIRDVIDRRRLDFLPPLDFPEAV